MLIMAKAVGLPGILIIPCLKEREADHLPPVLFQPVKVLSLELQVVGSLFSGQFRCPFQFQWLHGQVVT